MERGLNNRSAKSLVEALLPDFATSPQNADPLPASISSTME
jgi:hypothetical protein